MSASSHKPEAVSLMRGRRPARILLADDERAVRETLDFLLHWSWTDFHLTTTSDGDVAWRLINRATPDLLITDQRHPGMPVDELLHRLYRTSKRFPILVCSAGLTQERRERLSAFTIFPVLLLPKPFDFDTLRQRVHCAFQLPPPTVAL